MTRKGLLTIFGAISLASLLVHCGQEDTAFTSQDAAGFAGKMTGRVVDKNGNPLSGALVTASPGGVTTASAADGSYEISGLAAGKYRLSYSKADYYDTTRSDPVTVGMLATDTLSTSLLHYRYAKVKGTVVDPSGMPLPMAGVVAEDQSASASCVSQGAFTLARVEPGHVRLFAAYNGVGYGYRDVDLAADTTLDIGKVSLQYKGGTVSGTVTDSLGHAISSAKVTAAGGGLTTFSDALGSYTLKNVPTTTTVVVDAGSLGKTSVTGISVLEGGSTSLPAVSIAPVATTTSASLPTLLPSFALGTTTDKELLLQVQDSLGTDSAWQVLRYLWSLDGGATWADSTALGTWHLQPSRLLGWGQGTTGKYQVVVRARVYKATGAKVLDTLTGATRITVQLMAPPDRTPPTITRVSPSSDTTMVWNDSVVTVAWKVSDDRKLGTVLVDGDSVAFAGGLVSRQYTLGVGRIMVRLLTRDSAGNVAQDSLLLVRSAAVVVPHDSTLSSLSVVSKSGAKLVGFSPKVQSYTDTVASTDSSVTVTAVTSDSLSKVTVNGTTSGTVHLSDTGNVTPIRIAVRAVDGDSLVYTVTVVRKAAIAHDTLQTSWTFATDAADSAAVNASYNAKTFSDNQTITTLKASSGVMRIDVNWANVPNWGANAGIDLALGKMWNAHDLSSLSSITFSYRTSDLKTALQFAFNSPLWTSVANDPLGKGDGVMRTYAGGAYVGTGSSWRTVTMDPSVDLVWLDWMSKQHKEEITQTWSDVSSQIKSMRFQPMPNYDASGATVTPSVAWLEIKDIQLNFGGQTPVNVSHDTTLSSLSAMTGVLTPSFVASVTNYVDTVASTATSEILLATASSASATVRGADTIDLSNVAAGGSKMDTITVVNGTKSLRYVVKIVKRAASVLAHDLTLSSLSIVSNSGVKLTGFSPKVQSYTDTIASTDSLVTVTAVASDTSSTVTINGSNSKIVFLSNVAGVTPIRIAVKAVDGDSLVYMVNVFRKAVAKIMLSTSATNGAITLSPSGGAYDTGTQVIATAVANAGYVFRTWTGADTSTSSICTLTVTKNMTLIANFTASAQGKITGDTGHFTDARDNQVYKWVKIGTQTWMAQNLNYQVDSSLCPGGADSYCSTYGRLYKWSTAMNLNDTCNTSTCSTQVSSKIQGICPSGWHVPSNAEWSALVQYADSAAAGTKLKSTSGWSLSNGTDAYGFSVLPAGYYVNELTAVVAYTAYFWSSYGGAASSAWDWSFSLSASVGHSAGTKSYGFSLRCLQNN